MDALHPEQVRERRDGMNPRTMEAGFLARFYMEHFMDASTVVTRGFRQRGIDMLAEQARQGAGFLVLWSRDESSQSRHGRRNPHAQRSASFHRSHA